MNFDFSEEQKALQAQVQAHFSDAFPVARVMSVYDGDLSERENIWRELVALGYPAMALPEHYGGAGFSYLELCLVAQEIGRFALPIPMLSQVYLAQEALCLFGDSRQQEQYLPKLASGTVSACAILLEDPNGTLGLQQKQAMLYGRAGPVPDAIDADIAIVRYQTESADTMLGIVDLRQAGVSRTEVAMLDEGWPHASIEFSNVSVEPLELSINCVDQLLHRAAILCAFEQLGGAQACLEQAKNYALERYSFGRPVASYQAIKHKMVDMYVAQKIALGHALYGAWALEEKAAETAYAAAGARIASTSAYEFAASENIHIHGGVGFTWEYPCHLHYKRSRILATALGNDRRWKHLLLKELRKTKRTHNGL